MTQTANTQIDRIIKRTDEITEKELARQELPNPRTQTNTTQNKEELEAKIKGLFRRGETINEDKLWDRVSTLLHKELSQAHQSGIEEGAEAERKRIEEKALQHIYLLVDKAGGRVEVDESELIRNIDFPITIYKEPTRGKIIYEIKSLKENKQ